MSDYNKITDYAAKDSLSTGDSAKRVKGSEIGADFDAVAVAVATKANLATPAFTTGIGVGATAAGAGGIAFPATAVAVADVNTLDDYEEGTFTPGISFSGGTTGITYGTQTGAYTKIGNRVIGDIYIVLTSKGSSNGNLLITGLPFTVGNAYNPVSIRSSLITFADFIMGYCDQGTTTIVFEETTNAGTVTRITDADFSNTSSIMVSFSYKV